MLHRFALVLAALAFGLGIYIPAAHAQGVVVAACGTPPTTLNVGTTIPFYIDKTTGNLCTAASLGSVTIGSVSQGAGNSANPWYVTPDIAGFAVTANAGTNLNTSLLAKESGGNLAALAATISGGLLQINCASGCTSGSFNNNADSVATSTTNGQAAAWPYLWNGSSWDRWYGDKTNGGFVNVKTSVLPTGAATSALQSSIISTLGSPLQAGGTVTANAGTNLNTSLLALESGGNLAVLSSTVAAGSVRVAIQGTPAVTVTGSVTANAGTNLNTSLLALESGGNLATLANTVSAGNVKVSIQGSPSVTVSGSVIANAGVNLNTSALALESGGNLAALAATISGGNLKVSVQGTPTVTANAGTNLNTSLLALESGGNLATIAGAISGAKFQDNLAQIGGTTVVTGGVAGTLAVGGNQIVNSNISTNTYPLLLGGSDYAGIPKIQLFKVDSGGSGYVNCSNCTGSGVSNTDQGSWVAGASTFASGGGFYQTVATDNPLTTGQFGTFQTTRQRALFTNLRNSSGVEIGTSSAPLTVQLSGSSGGATAVSDPLLESTVNPLTKSQNVNISSMSPFFSLSASLDRVGGQPYWIGSQVSAKALPVVIASDQTVPIAVAQTVSVVGTGTAGVPGTAALTVQGIPGGTPLVSNITQLGSNALVTSGVNGTLAIGGNQAAGANISTNVFPELIGGSDYSGTPKIQNWKVDTSGSGYVNCSNCTGSGVSQTDEATFIPATTSFTTAGGFYQANPAANPLTNLQMGVYQMTQTRSVFSNLRDALGNEWNASNPLPVQDPYLQQRIVAAMQTGPQWASKSLSVVVARDQAPIPVSLPNEVVVSPLAARSQNWTGTAASADSSAHTLAVKSLGRIYVTGVQCFRTDAGSTMDYLTLSDTAGTTVALPPLGGSNVAFASPLKTAMQTDLTFTVSAAITTVFCNAQGFYALN